MTGDVAFHLLAGSVFLGPYCDACLFFKPGDVQIQRAFKTRIVEYHRMKRLGQSANLVEGALHNLTYFLQIAAQGWVERSCPAVSPLQHRAECGQDLAK